MFSGKGQKMIEKFKSFTKSSKIWIILRCVFDNCRMGINFAINRKSSKSGSIHLNKSLPESLLYINTVFDDYLKYSDITNTMLRGKNILEIGPGDNFGVALKFLAEGAASFVCIDKFYSERDISQQIKIYKALRMTLGDDSKSTFDKAIELSSGVGLNPDMLRYIYGVGIEESEELFQAHSLDIIISRAVMEHLRDSTAAFLIMDKLLTPGGYMIHKIDFRDHGMFSTCKKYHPLTFLTIPKPIYRLMTSNAGRPNRKLINYYTETLKDLGYDTKILITHITGKEEELIPHKKTITLNVDYSKTTSDLIIKIRPRLDDEFKKMSDEELMVAGIFLVARKPC